MLKISELSKIGKRVKIIESSDLTKNNLEGQVIFVTKNTYVIRTQNKIKEIKKNEILNLKEI